MAPIINRGIKILILGTYPGPLSIEKGEYYADPKNKFWDLVGLVTDKDFRKMTYSKKKEELLESGIGIWDIFKSVKRVDGADRNIDVRGSVLNDFKILKKNCPKLKTVYFNGKTAWNYGKKEINDIGLNSFLLLSSSGANNGRSGERELQWRKILK